MTIQEYNLKELELRKKHEEGSFLLIKEYTLSNNPYKIGDTVKDNSDKIVIEKISVYKSFGEIGCRYYGIKLKKDGTPFKSGEKAWVHQRNII